MAMAVPEYCQMCGERTRVKACGVSIGIAQIVGTLAENSPLPRLVRACAGIHRAPGRHPVAPRVGAGPIEGVILACVLGGIRPVLLAGAGCKHRALSRAPLSNRTPGVHGGIARACPGPMEGVAYTGALMIARPVLWHMQTAQRETIVAASTFYEDQSWHSFAGRQASACDSCRHMPPCPNP